MSYEDSLNNYYFPSDSYNDFQCPSKSPMQEYYESFNQVILGAQDESNLNSLQNVRSDELNTFLELKVSDINNTPISIAKEPPHVSNGFDDYINILDYYDNILGDAQDANSQINNFGINEDPFSNNYTYVPPTQAFADSFNGMLDTQEFEFVDENITEILEKNIPFIEKFQKKIEKEESNKRKRGRPRTDLSKLEIKVREAESGNEKTKIRVTKNNKASKEYRDRRSLKKKQLDNDLAIETLKYKRLKKIHTKFSDKINKLELLLKAHSI